MKNFWYVLKVLSGKEKSLTEQLNQQISLGRIKNVNRFVCPIEQEYVTAKNKKFLKSKVIYNGYIYFESPHKLNEDELKEFSNIPNTISMFGNKLPLLLSKTDVEKILKDDILDEHNEHKKTKYLIGEIIIINDGPFKTFEGVVSKINEDKIDVDVKIFGKTTTVSLFEEHILKLK